MTHQKDSEFLPPYGTLERFRFMEPFSFLGSVGAWQSLQERRQVVPWVGKCWQNGWLRLVEKGNLTCKKAGRTRFVAIEVTAFSAKDAMFFDSDRPGCLQSVKTILRPCWG